MENGAGQSYWCTRTQVKVAYKIFVTSYFWEQAKQIPISSVLHIVDLLLEQWNGICSTCIPILSLFAWQCIVPCLTAWDRALGPSHASMTRTWWSRVSLNGKKHILGTHDTWKMRPSGYSRICGLVLSGCLGSWLGNTVQLDLINHLVFLQWPWGS